jgi:hypothetical protein
MEFVDFLQALRGALGRGCEIVVVPVTTEASGAATANQPGHVEVWRRKLARIGDPWLRIEEVRR